MRQGSVWWFVAALATALAIAVPAVLWQTWSDAAAPEAPKAKAVSAKRAQHVAAVATKKAAAGKDRAADRSPSQTSGAGIVSFDRDGRPQARFVALRLTDPAGSGALPGQRYVEMTVGVQNLTAASLRLPAATIQVRDAAGGLHAPATVPAAAPAATPASAPVKRAGRATKPAKPVKATRQGATPRAGNRPAKNRGQAAASAATELDLGPGQTRVVTLRYALPATVRVASILLAPDANHLVSLAVLPQSAAAVGTPAASTARRDRPAKTERPRATPPR